jgi:hypothetical protein
LVVDLAEAVVAEFFVEGQGLEGEGVEPDADAAVSGGDLFGLCEELAA